MLDYLMRVCFLICYDSFTYRLQGYFIDNNETLIPVELYRLLHILGDLYRIYGIFCWYNLYN